MDQERKVIALDFFFISSKKFQTSMKLSRVEFFIKKIRLNWDSQSWRPGRPRTLTSWYSLGRGKQNIELTNRIVILKLLQTLSNGLGAQSYCIRFFFNCLKKFLGEKEIIESRTFLLRKYRQIRGLQNHPSQQCLLKQLEPRQKKFSSYKSNYDALTFENSF